MQGTMNAIATGGATAIKKEEVKKPVTGYEAQGFAIAMRVLGIQRTAARELHRCVVSLFDLAPEARGAAAKHLATRKDAIAELVAQGRLDEKEAKRMMASATTYSSQMRTIIKAMNNGMTMVAVLDWCNGRPLAAHESYAPEAFDSVGFATIYKVAQTYKSGESRGRPEQTFAEKLAAWLKKNGPDTKDTPSLVLYNKVVQEVNAAAEG